MRLTSCLRQLYPNHIPTSVLQKLLLAGGSAAAALSDPWRDDMVAVNGEVTGGPALRYMHGKVRLVMEREMSDFVYQMMESEEGRQILTDRPRVRGDILPRLSQLPPNTLGHQYAAFMERFKLSPDSRAEVMFVDDVELSYVMTRYRETHDLSHCLLAQPPNMVGEVVVKWVEALQFRLPMCVGGAVFGPLRFGEKQREEYGRLLGWAVRTGTEASFLLNTYYEKRWDQDLADLRRELNISLPDKTSH